MAKESLTIAQVKERKIALESEILTLVTSFEEETGVRISYVGLQRQKEDSYGTCGCGPDNYHDRPLVNVSAEMGLDLI